MPAKAILAGAALLVAVLFVIAAFRGTWRLPAIGVGLMVISAIIVGGIYPAVVQRFQVKPNEQVAESTYIQRNIDATKAAFGLDGVQITPYDAKLVAEQGALRSDAETTASIRLLDPSIVGPSFSQLQQNKQYYGFPSTLAVDRYTINGESRDTVIAARGLNLNGLDPTLRTWVNDHTVYTHGFGIVAAYGNTTAADGRPGVLRGRHPADRRPGQLRAADLLRRVAARLLDRRRAGRQRQLGAGLPGRLRGRPGQHDLPDPDRLGRAEHRQPVEQAALLAEVRVRADPVRRPGHLGLADPVRP